MKRSYAPCARARLISFEPSVPTRTIFGRDDDRVVDVLNAERGADDIDGGTTCSSSAPE